MNSICEKMIHYKPSGNVIPSTWYQIFRKPTGKPYLNAIVLLADIVYWYRPAEVRDEHTGRVIGYKKRFKADLLQRSYSQISELFGFSKRDATNAVIFLEEMGVVKRHFRSHKMNGVNVVNVLYLELIPEALFELERQAVKGLSEGYHSKKGDPLTETGDTLPLISETPSTENYGTNTEITTKNTTEITNKDNIYIDSIESTEKAPRSSKTEPAKNQRLKEYEAEFDILWKMYPRKQGKPAAKKHYLKARRDGVEYDTIETALLEYKEYIQLKGLEDQYIKQGGTWFNGYWEDDYSEEIRKIKERKGYGVYEGHTGSNENRKVQYAYEQIT